MAQYKLPFSRQAADRYVQEYDQGLMRGHRPTVGPNVNIYYADSHRQKLELQHELQKAITLGEKGAQLEDTIDRLIVVGKTRNEQTPERITRRMLKSDIRGETRPLVVHVGNREAVGDRMTLFTDAIHNGNYGSAIKDLLDAAASAYNDEAMYFAIVADTNLRHFRDKQPQQVRPAAWGDLVAATQWILGNPLRHMDKDDVGLSNTEADFLDKQIRSKKRKKAEEKKEMDWFYIDLMSPQGRREAIARYTRLAECGLPPMVAENNRKRIGLRSHLADTQREMMSWIMEGPETFMNNMSMVAGPPTGLFYFRPFAFRQGEHKMAGELLEKLPEDVHGDFLLMLVNLTPMGESDTRREVMEILETVRERGGNVKAFLANQTSSVIIAKVLNEVDSLTIDQKSELAGKVAHAVQDAETAPGGAPKELERLAEVCRRLDPVLGLPPIPSLLVVKEMAQSVVGEKPQMEFLSHAMAIAETHESLGRCSERLKKASPQHWVTRLQELHDAARLGTGQTIRIIKGGSTKERAVSVGEIDEWVKKQVEGVSDDERTRLGAVTRVLIDDTIYIAQVADATYRVLAETKKRDSARDFWDIYSFNPTVVRWDGSMDADPSISGVGKNIASDWSRSGFINNPEKMKKIAGLFWSSGGKTIDYGSSVTLAMSRSRQHYETVMESDFPDLAVECMRNRRYLVEEFLYCLQNDLLDMARAYIVLMGADSRTENRVRQMIRNSEVAEEDLQGTDWGNVNSENVVGVFTRARDDRSRYLGSLARYNLNGTRYADLSEGLMPLRDEQTMRDFRERTRSLPADLRDTIVGLAEVHAERDQDVAVALIRSRPLTEGFASLADTPDSMRRYVRNLGERAANFTADTVDDACRQAYTEDVRIACQAESTIDWSDTTGEQRTQVMDWVLAQSQDSPEMRQVLTTRPAAELAKRIGDQQYIQMLRSFIKDSAWIDELPNKG